MTKNTKKILKVVLIIVLSLIGLLISMSPIFIILAVLAIVTTLKSKEMAETPFGKADLLIMDSFKNMMDSFAAKSDSSPQNDEEYETRKVGEFFTIKVPKHPQGASQKKADSQPKTEVNPHYTEEQAKRLLRYIHDSTAMDTVRIKVEPMNKGSDEDFYKRACSSRFGGLPYWTRGEEYPKSEDGEVLYLLAQINFAEVPHIDDYPVRGLLQIFIKADDTYGCNFDAEQKDWRIVWRDVFSPSLAMSEAELGEMGVKCAGEEKSEMPLPLQKEYALIFEKCKTYSHPHLDDFDGVLKNAAQVLGFPVYDKSPYELLDSDSLSAFYCDGEQHQIGGYPDFTQNDVRREGDILLFQMDGAGEISWGDSGIANFFIPPADLKAHNFSNVLYNWDCY